MCVSLLGDGVFLVALAWQVYELSGGPAAMGMVGIAMTVPTIAFLLIGGALSDRLNRRNLMLAADSTRMLATAALATLSLTGAVEVWHICFLVAVYGTGQAFFAPAFDAIVPELIPEHQLAQANALDQLVRPIALRMLGPAVGGVLVGAAGAGAAFALDSPASPSASGRCCSCARRSWHARPDPLARWSATCATAGASSANAAGCGSRSPSAAFAYLLFMGPVEVLVPYVVKHDLGGAATDLGLIFGAGGLASILSAIVLGQLGLPRRSMTVMYLVWTIATIAVAGYGLGTTVWQLMLASAVFNALETAGTIIWATAKQQHVPSAMLGRVSSLDWLISIGLLPLSFALTAPVSAALGARETLGRRRRRRRRRHARGAGSCPVCARSKRTVLGAGAECAASITWCRCPASGSRLSAARDGAAGRGRAAPLRAPRSRPECPSPGPMARS